MTPCQLWSIFRGRKTNFRWMDASWTYTPKLNCVRNWRVLCPGGDSDDCCLNEDNIGQKIGQTSGKSL